MESILEKLAKYDISQYRYMRQKEILLSFGFDIDQCEKLKNIGFTGSDIVNIVSNGGDSKTLQAIIDLQPKLKNIGFTDADIVNISSNGGDSKTLQTVIQTIIDLQPKLKNLGFNDSDIVTIASNMVAVLNLFQM